MVQYRRLRVNGGYYFFTITLQNRKSKILTQHIHLLRESWIKTKNRHPFKTIAYVILPDHFHTIWQLPENDDDFVKRIRLIKSTFTKKIVAIRRDFSKNHRGEYNIWQKRYWEHMIRNEKDYENHVNYIHYNPVKHRLVRRVRDWPHSSFMNFVKDGIHPVNWSEDKNNEDLPYPIE